ncbi:MAG TPA: CPBP family intramembrane glutamic endopeptidase [Levilinea sp.]|nr:CPBP family intramembrane glutamic endopeptidase [Levilinea sp.]
MPNIFRDPIERRLRALWRLILQGLIFFVLLAGMQIVSGILAGALIETPAGLDFGASQDFILNHPLLRIAIALSQLIAISISFLIASRWLDRRPLPAFGLHLNARWWRDLGFGLILGALLMALVFVVELAAGWIEVTGYAQPGGGGHGFWPGILSAFLLFLSVGIYEELLFRGYLLRNIAEGLEGRRVSPRATLIIAFFLSSAIFGVAHAANPNATALSTLNITVAGLFLGLGFILTGELAIPIGLHISWNFFQGNVFGFPVSGMQFGATFIQIDQLGAELITGGGFGPEAGLLGLAAMLLGALLTMAWVRFNYGTLRLYDELAVYRPLPYAKNSAAETA